MQGRTDGEIVKTDTRGRVWTTAARRAELMVEFERSGMSGMAFSQWAGIKYSTFANWRRQRRKGVVAAKRPFADSSPGPIHWVEAVVGRTVPSGSGASALVVDLSNGVRLSVGDGVQAQLAGILLRELLTAGKVC